MKDKELLELAAKAANVKGKYYYKHGTIGIAEPCELNGVGCIWNPLVDDGDALRLAVKLGLNVNFVGDEVNVFRFSVLDSYVCDVYQEFSSDKDAATRRAIVESAAEFAKAKGEA